MSRPIRSVVDYSLADIDTKLKLAWIGPDTYLLEDSHHDWIHIKENNDLNEISNNISIVLHAVVMQGTEHNMEIATEIYKAHRVRSIFIHDQLYHRTEEYGMLAYKFAEHMNIAFSKALAQSIYLPAAKVSDLKSISHSERDQIFNEILYTKLR